MSIVEISARSQDLYSFLYELPNYNEQILKVG